MKSLKIYKVGGQILNDLKLLDQFLIDFSLIKGYKILVHGGGAHANILLSKLGITPKMINGRRITDIQTLDVLVSLYAGLINKKLVVKLQKLGCNTLGLSGCDGNSIKGNKRLFQDVDFGYVGDVISKSINVNFVKLIILNNIIPVFCAIIHDGNGVLLNTNADTIAGTLAQALAVNFNVQLYYCFDKIGVLKDINDDKSFLPIINKKIFYSLLEKKLIHSGMIPKLENAFLVLEKGVKNVFLQHPKNINSEIYTEVK